MKRLILGTVALSLMLTVNGCSKKSEYNGDFDCKDKTTGIVIKLKVDDNKIAMGLDDMFAPATSFKEEIIKKGGKELKVAMFTSSEGKKTFFGKKDGKFWIADKNWEAYCTKK